LKERRSQRKGIKDRNTNIRNVGKSAEQLQCALTINPYNFSCHTKKIILMICSQTNSAV
jgi:hypothetical protein